MSTVPIERNYAPVNGLNMYYEIHNPNASRPLVLIHGGGSTIESTFGRILPQLVQTRQVIALELQAHGHTKDIARPLTFEQDADDVAAVLQYLHVSQADIFGFSNGGMSAIQLAIRHPQVVGKLILASVSYQRSGMRRGFFEGLQHATLKDLPPALKDAYLAASRDDGAGLDAMFQRDRTRMLTFTGFDLAALRRIEAPTFILNGDQEVVLPEHALALQHILPHAQVVILPGGHGEYLGEICARNPKSKLPSLVVEMVEEFLGASQ